MSGLRCGVGRGGAVHAKFWNSFFVCASISIPSSLSIFNPWQSTIYIALQLTHYKFNDTSIKVFKMKFSIKLFVYDFESKFWANDGV